jgi:hypothetical protein
MSSLKLLFRKLHLLIAFITVKPGYIIEGDIPAEDLERSTIVLSGPSVRVPFHVGYLEVKEATLLTETHLVLRER